MIAPADLLPVEGDAAASCNDWILWLANEKRLSAHTVEAYRGDLYAFLRFAALHRGGAVSHGALAALSLGDFRAWVAHLADSDHAASSRSRMLSSVRSYFGFLDRRGILHNAAIGLLRSPKLPEIPAKTTDSRTMLPCYSIMPQETPDGPLDRPARPSPVHVAVRRGLCTSPKPCRSP